MSDLPAGLPWPPGAATGIGSLPGTDIAEAVRLAFGELPDLPYLPELPARGPGADLLGRGAGLLVELPVELYAGRWRLAVRPGVDARRTADLRERDLDALGDHAGAYEGPLKLQVAGPWTLAAGLELPRGGPALRDPGAVRDLAAALAEGLARHLTEVAERVPGARTVLQLDEPSLPAVLAGAIPTESGLFRLPPVEPTTAQQTLHDLITAAAVPSIIHCCAPDVPVTLLQSAGAIGIALDLDLVTDLDPLGEALDTGMALLAGAVPASLRRAPRSHLQAEQGSPTQEEAPRAAEVAERIRSWWRDLGLAEDRLPVQVVVTPTCGLAGATPGYARAALAACRDAARRLAT